MIIYPHFAISGLLLRNGYREIETADGSVREYVHENQLEHCVRRLLLRKPERLRGWDLRFLRRGLELSQAQFGQMIDRDAQTVARMEKSERKIPTFVDLTIRTRFSERFEPAITLREVLDYVDGRAAGLPKKIVLEHVEASWTCATLMKPRTISTISASLTVLVVSNYSSPLRTGFPATRPAISTGTVQPELPGVMSLFTQTGATHPTLELIPFSASEGRFALISNKPSESISSEDDNAEDRPMPFKIHPERRVAS